MTATLRQSGEIRPPSIAHALVRQCICYLKPMMSIALALLSWIPCHRRSPAIKSSLFCTMFWNARRRQSTNAADPWGGCLTVSGILYWPQMPVVDMMMTVRHDSAERRSQWSPSRSPLHKRWRKKALRNRLARAGFKPPETAVVKSQCGERSGKGGARSLSGRDQEDECKRTADDVSKA